MWSSLNVVCAVAQSDLISLLYLSLSRRPRVQHDGAQRDVAFFGWCVVCRA